MVQDWTSLLVHWSRVNKAMEERNTLQFNRLGLRVKDQLRKMKIRVMKELHRMLMY